MLHPHYPNNILIFCTQTDPVMSGVAHIIFGLAALTVTGSVFFMHLDSVDPYKLKKLSMMMHTTYCTKIMRDKKSNTYTSTLMHL